MKTDLPTKYDPQAVEKHWYDFWLERGYFHADVAPGRPKYCITIPPPNVTGELHMGHALQHSIHDLIIRWKRMQGFNTLCLPGTDHASISTQMKVVQQLQQEGLSRHDLGREKFIERCWQWTEKYGGTILSQLKSLGCSYDWRRTRFTLDDAYCRAVLTAFVHYYERGWIYRGHRVIQWCIECQTTVSDLEMVHKEITSSLWHLRYPAADGDGEIVVATTRPETMLGDTAVAVHPGDDRYRDMVGRELMLPLMNRRIPVVADEHVNPEFGTGAVKVTPAHDPNDFEIGQRHGLPQLIVIGTDGKMTSEAGEYAGLDRQAARRRVEEDLREGGFLVKIEEHTHQVGHHDRCDTILEPLLMEQWFVKMRELADMALAQIRRDEVRFIPERYAAQEIQWLENIRDWNISRQLWWGQRVPVWTCEACGKVIVQADAPENCTGCNSAQLRQDEDVLDTWFSSALWPFATLGWPEVTPELEYFYPTDLMITARDILYLWIARMMYCSQEFMGTIPFRDVLVHPTVQTHEGKRMSKSLGTGIDPLDLTERFGTDATRFGLYYQCGGSQDIRFTEERLEMARNFCNKLWNASRFVLMNLADEEPPAPAAAELARGGGLEPADRWILSRLQRAVADVTAALGAYAVDDAAQRIYSFVWDEFCDWYVELAKPRLSAPGESIDPRRVLLHVLESTLRLAHPFMPFITEALWQSLPGTGESIMIARYPTPESVLQDSQTESEIASTIDILRTARQKAMEAGQRLNQPFDLFIYGKEPKHDIARDYAGRILTRANIMNELAPENSNVFTAAASGAVVSVPISGSIDLTSELQKTDAEIAGLLKEYDRAAAKIANEKFLSRAPQAIVAKERRILAELEAKLEQLRERRRRFAP
jgi:valyl-tRNA synthetase